MNFMPDCLASGNVSREREANWFHSARDPPESEATATNFIGFNHSFSKLAQIIPVECNQHKNCRILDRTV